MIPLTGARGWRSRADNAEAGDLIQKATQDFQNQQLTAAQDKLDKAKKINPHQTNLNAMYGSLYLMQNKSDDAFEAFRTELKAHPDNLRVARWFAQMLVRMNRPDEAMEAYRAILKTVPDDIDANTELGRMLLERENWKEAQPVLERTMKLRPDSVQVAAWYGQSCLKNGKVTEGIAALTRAAEAATDPAMLSLVASSLVEDEKSRQLARQAAERAVKLIEEETGKVALGEITPQQMKRMADLAQIWDRMGWVAFKNGDLPVAERYIQAAWMLSHDPAAGDHLGQIYEQQGKLAQALEAYTLALARRYPTVPGLDDRVKALRKRMGASIPVHSGRNQASDTDRLQNLRMIKIARGKPMNGSADFLIMFVNGKPAEVKELGGDAALQPLGEALKTAEFSNIFPDAGPEHVVRQGILSCSAYDSKCMFLMMLPNDATASSRMPVPIGQGQTTVIQLHQ
jgi:tetratricopeptide (TPR) repeat protein